MRRQNRHPAGTSVGGQWAPGWAAEIDVELLESPAAGEYIETCRQTGASPQREVFEQLSQADSDDEARQILDRASDEALAESLDDARRSDGSWSPAAASRARAGYVARCLRRGLTLSPRHLRALESMTFEHGNALGRLLDDYLQGLRRMR